MVLKLFSKFGKKIKVGNIAVGCLKFKVDFQNILLIYLWVLFCFKFGDNGFHVSCKGLTLCRVQTPVQIKPILLEISDLVIKYLLAGSGKVSRQ